MMSLEAENQPIPTTDAVALGDRRLAAKDTIRGLRGVVVLDLIIDGLLLSSGTSEVQAR